MNKAKEALDNLFFNLKTNDYYLGDEANDDYILIEKSLTALEIIKEKGIVVQFVKETYSVEQYNAVISGYLLKPFTQEEYDLLKEVLL